ncbi:hypothetical protein [Modestobacter sp. SSW1-42]|uniref:hypothetical protein n=1 Tax=Modestobacter sp. SSW1-42 TaxID=596372 RepID=UPI0039881A76
MSGPVQPPTDGSPYPQPAAWTPSGAWAPAAPATAPAGAPRGPGVRGVVLALAGAAVGAAVAALVVSVVLVSGARELVREAGTAAGDSIAVAVGGGVYGYEDEGVSAPYGMPEPEQFPAVEPGELGPDPVLDTYARDCFGGELQSCDDLYFQAPPLSSYEEYGGTCGGRVKTGSVYARTELD